ncbi:hypothetical protein [Niveispirillum sp. KHB5.9]|uniref:hypothetical protein n=1 Tax=Niveispirillum sp. KHB5.9 TaxID=3400269 RepID=UPI003A8AB2BB
MQDRAEALEQLREEAQLSHEAGRPARFWWRDDDLVANSANFDALTGLAVRFHAPLLVAVIPGMAAAMLDLGRADPGLVHFCQHGWKHTNHLTAGPGKSEFGGDRAPDTVLAEIAAGRDILVRLLGDRFMPVFVPPWNAFDPGHLPALTACGLTGLSTYGHRPGPYAADGIRLANTHIDILRWDAPGGPKALAAGDVFDRLAQLVRRQRLDPGADPEPIGILSHHRAMGDDAWALLDGLFDAINGMPGAGWAAPPAIFAPPSSAQ